MILQQSDIATVVNRLLKEKSEKLIANVTFLGAVRDFLTAAANYPENPDSMKRAVNVYVSVLTDPQIGPYLEQVPEGFRTEAALKILENTRTLVMHTRPLLMRNIPNLVHREAAAITGKYHSGY